MSDQDSKAANPTADEPENGGEPEEVILQPEIIEAGDAGDDKLKRLMADFDNFRRRSAKERAQERQRGRRDATEKLLPVFDSLTSGLLALKADDPARKGLQVVYNQLLSAFEQLGLERIPTKGEKFDPAVMEGIAHFPHPEHAEGIVLDESRAGFRDELGLLRAAQVVVSAGS